MTDLIERLRTELVSANKHGDPDLAALLRDTLAALEAAREARVVRASDAEVMGIAGGRHYYAKIVLLGDAAKELGGRDIRLVVVPVPHDSEVVR